MKIVSKTAHNFIYFLLSIFPDTCDYFMYVIIYWAFRIDTVTATQLEIGLQREQYATHDNAGYQVVCATIISGSIDGEYVQIFYTVTDDGMILSHVTYIYSLYAL